MNQSARVPNVRIKFRFKVRSSSVWGGFILRQCLWSPRHYASLVGISRWNSEMAFSFVPALPPCDEHDHPWDFHDVGWNSKLWIVRKGEATLVSCRTFQRDGNEQESNFPVCHWLTLRSLKQLLIRQRTSALTNYPCPLKQQHVWVRSKLWNVILHLASGSPLTHAGTKYLTRRIYSVNRNSLGICR